MKVPIVKLSLPDEVIEEVNKTLKSGLWVEGPAVRALEKEFAEYCGVKYCRAVNSGTSALVSIIGSLGLKPGDEVIVPSFTFIATANCLIPFGLKPVFADIDPNTYNISPDSVRSKITEKTKAIISVDLYGLPANYKELNEIAEEKDIPLIEDACQAHGAEFNGKKTGSFGLAAAFSLYPTKNMYCGGEGGLITTNDEELYNKINMFVNHGQKAKYIHSSFGLNFRMPAVSGICARYSLKQLDKNNEKRISNAQYYNEHLSDIKGLVLPHTPEGYKHVFHQYTIQTDMRDALSEQFSKSEIGYGIHYKIPIHKQEFYINQGYSDHLPNTEAMASKVISLPIHPELTTEQLDYVVQNIKKVLK